MSKSYEVSEEAREAQRDVDWRASFNEKVASTGNLPDEPEPEEEDENIPDPETEPISYRLYTQGYGSEEELEERIRKYEAEGDWRSSFNLKAALAMANKWEA